jgi:hypothetical protein
MKPTFVLLVGTVALVGAMGVVAADTGASPFPHNETDNATEVSPGQQLAGAVGAQGASVRGELWNRTLTERLDNATGPEERAEVVIEETELLNASVEMLNESRENLTEAWEDGELTEGEYRAGLSEFVVHAYAVERRANQTVRAAEDLPGRTRDRADVNLTRIRTLEERAGELYEFDGEIAHEVANETLDDQSADSKLPWADDGED